MYDKTFARKMTILLPFIGIILYLISDDVRNLMIRYLPVCYFYSLFHLYCPACGNTRSVTALLHGDILGSLRYNIVPPLLVLIGLLAYIELATYSFGTHRRLLPRRLSFYLILIALLVIYFIVRNLIPYLTPAY
ncbi:MAG TPA: DUF2752 domain-containing protein [Mobilitalea sp.]|nr:DUF2752 domain-containing protein [Mobilitalea sp.]